MAIALEGRIEWRMKAPYHVQVRLDQDAQPLIVPSEISVRGTVVRVFKSDGRLRCGECVGFHIWVCQPGDEPTGQAFVYYEQFSQASYVEAYLRGAPPNCELAAYEFVLISAPSDQPSMTVAQLQELTHSSIQTEQQPVNYTRSWWRRIFLRQQ
jgi:hypothetical protein